MQPLSFDSSIAAAWRFPDERSDYTNAVPSGAYPLSKPQCPVCGLSECGRSANEGERRRKTPAPQRQMNGLHSLWSRPLACDDFYSGAPVPVSIPVNGVPQCSRSSRNCRTSSARLSRSRWCSLDLSTSAFKLPIAHQGAPVVMSPLPVTLKTVDGIPGMVESSHLLSWQIVQMPFGPIKVPRTRSSGRGPAPIMVRITWSAGLYVDSYSSCKTTARNMRSSFA